MKHFAIVTCVLALAACSKSAEKGEDTAPKSATATTETATATAATTAAATTGTAAATTIKVEDGDLSTPADFEETAEKAITAKTYKAELATLEADLAKE